MNRKFQKILALLLMITLSIGLSASSFADSQKLLSVTENNEKRCVVREITKEGVTIATNDKQSNILTIEKYDKSETKLIKQSM